MPNSCGSHNIQSNQKLFCIRPLNRHAEPVFAIINHFGTFKTEIECIPCARGIYNRIATKSF
jgi:hypothetical protein